MKSRPDPAQGDATLDVRRMAEDGGNASYRPTASLFRSCASFTLLRRDNRAHRRFEYDPSLDRDAQTKTDSALPYMGGLTPSFSTTARAAVRAPSDFLKAL